MNKAVDGESVKSHVQICFGSIELPVILPLASDGGCQLMLMDRGRPSLLTTVTSLGADVGTEEIKIGLVFTEHLLFMLIKDF